MKKKIIATSLALLTIGLGIFGWRAWQRQEASKKLVHEPIPTLFFHGGFSSYHAEEHMVNAAKNAGVTDNIAIAFVDEKGKVTLKGRLKKNVKNPIVMVNFEKHFSTMFEMRGQHATNVVKELQKVYKFKQVNMVGHSFGNIAVLHYMLQNGQNKALPQVHKYVGIAGHYAGLSFDNRKLPDTIMLPQGLKIDAQGKPNKINASYRELTKLRETYPKNQVKILNLMGDIGDHSDGRVPNAATQSLKYLVSPFAKSYEERTFTGPKASHSKLHSNPEVDKVLIDFLWGT